MAERGIRRAAALAAAVLLMACATTVEVPPPAAPGRPSEFPEAYFQALRDRGTPVFQVDPARSRVVILVQRGGTLAQFGHDHVIVSHDVGGYVATEARRADLYLPLDSLVVDDPELRSEFDLDTQPSASYIAGTRNNMLEKVLETGRFPYVTVAVDAPPPSGDPRGAPVSVTLHGVTRTVDAPLQYESTGEALVATGTLAIEQSEFGITPFSILGGAIAVQDRVDISFRIVATRVH